MTDDVSTNMLIRLVETLTLQIGTLTREVGELKGMLSAWELDRERMSEHRDAVNKFGDKMDARVSKVESRYINLRTTIIVMIVAGAGSQWPSIVRMIGVI